ncbi:MAG TPA: hypothetical protein PKC28_03030 [Bdellovibrionales bacterium]|nr:hypothetical protein [Bdellovibrionales bacterium]
MKYLIAVFSMLVSITCLAESEEGPQKDRVGPGKAVIEASKEQGFRLSEKALKTLDLNFVSVNGTYITLPRSVLIHFQDFAAVYRLRDGWFRLVEIEPTFRGEQVSFSSKDLKHGDQLVVHNGSLLRVVELDVFGPEADACAD